MTLPSHYTSYLPAFPMPCTMHNPLLKLISETPTPRLPKNIYFKSNNVHLQTFLPKRAPPPLFLHSSRAAFLVYSARKYFLNVRCS